MTDLEFIRANLPQEEQLAQLAEEATELAQAALKYRRTLDGTNPARISTDEAFERLLEEVADVELSLMVLGIPYNAQDADHICEIIAEKMARWRRSLENPPETTEGEIHEAKTND